MKKILSIIVGLLAAFSANAETIDLGALELDTDYALSTFKGYKAHYTAEQSGVLVFSTTTTDDLEPFSDEACKSKLNYTSNGQYGAHNYDLNVEAGKTYYFYTNFVMNSNTTIRISMAEKQEITLVGSSPELGGVFNVSNGGQISFNFSKAVAFSGATITIAGQTQKLAGAISNTSIFFNDTKDLIWNALSAGTLKSGDTFTITLNGVRMSANSSVLYDGTGTLVANFIVGPMPITLVSTKNTDTPFLSYYTYGNEAGIVKLTFSDKVNPAKLNAILKYGNIDKDPEGDYYVEYITPVLSEDSMTVIVSLQGKRRKAVDMIASGDDYGVVTIGVTGVMDKNGNYAYAAGSGSLGSYWYEKTFEEISANVVAEFTPANGADITEKTKSFEIWITDEDKLSYEGIQFAYEKEGKQDTLLVTNINKEQDPDDPTAKILTFDVPSELIGAENIQLAFKNLQSADGSDFSNLLRAKYNALVISRATPVANSTMEALTDGQEIKIYTNKDASLDKLSVLLRDMNYNSVRFEDTAEKMSTGKGFSYICNGNYRLLKNHEYRLEVVGYNGSEVVGTDYIVYKGAAEAITGDVNNDGTVDISDVNAVIAVICGGTSLSQDSQTRMSEQSSSAPEGERAGERGPADVNADGTVDISDVNAVISIICGEE